MIEKKIIGNMLLNRDMRLNALDVLREDFFQDEKSKNSFRVMKKIMEEDQLKDYSIDVYFDLAKKHKVDLDYVYIAEATGETQFYSKEWYIVLGNFIGDFRKKHIAETGLEVANKLLHGDMKVDDAIDLLKDRIQETSIEASGSSFTNAVDLVSEGIKKIEERASMDGLSGLETGFKSCDEIFDGWQRGNLIILGGRPAMGKSAFALQTLLNVVREGGSGAFFSLEMPKLEVTRRILATETDTHLGKIKKGQLNKYDWQRLNSKISWLVGAKDRFLIDDRPGLTVSQIRSAIRLQKKKSGIDFIVIDYLQLMGVDNNKYNNRNYEIEEITKTLKIIAKEEDIVVFLLSQLGRAVESTPDKQPQLSHLRDSGAIEQDADVVGFAYRPDYYGIEEDEDGNSTKGSFYCLWRKNRNGELANLKMKCDLSKQKIWEERDMDFETFDTPNKSESQHDFPTNENPVF